MRKTLIGIGAAVIIVAIGAYFGSDLWAQFRTKNDVQAVFDSLKPTFPTATHGKIELYSKTRSVKISDVVLQTADKSTTIKIGQIFAVGTRGPAAGRISADRLEITNWELEAAIPTAAGPNLAYKAPSIVIEGFTGLPAFPIKVDTASALDVIRGCLEYLAASTANSVKIPKLTINVTPSPKSEPTPALAPFEYTYTDILLRELRNRRIAEITTERVTVTSDMATPDLGSLAAAMAKFSVKDFNFDAVIALVDPAKANDDNYVQMYGPGSVGPIEFRFAKGGALQVETFSFDGFAIRPSKLALSTLLSIADAAPKGSTPPTPEQVREMLDKVAGIYEGFRFGKMEMRGLRTDIPPSGPIKLAAMRLTGYDNGRLAEFAIEGVDGTTKQNEPVKIGRFALKGLNFSKVLRQSSQMMTAGGPPSVEQSLALFSVLEGIEISDVSGQNPVNQQPFRIETIQFSWGTFVGPIPTTVRLTSKMTVPSNLADPGMGGMLADAGMPNITTSLDVGLAWNEANKTLVLSPAALELEGGFVFGMKFSLLNVTREMFSVDVMQAMAAAQATEVGPLEITLRDTGAVKKALEQYAKMKSLSYEDAQKEVTNSVMENYKTAPLQTPESQAAAEALVQFIEKPGSTYSLKITPKSRVTVNQIIGVGAGDPNAAIALFTIEAKTTQ